MGMPHDCGECKLFDGGFTQSALRHTDSASKGLIVRGVCGKLEVGHEIAHFAAIIEANGADEPVRQVALSKPFSSARLCELVR